MEIRDNRDRRDRDRDKDKQQKKERTYGAPKRYCRFCGDSNNKIEYKEPKLLQPFISEKGKIVPRRLTGNCAYHQRRVMEAVKRARTLAFLSFDTGPSE